MNQKINKAIDDIERTKAKIAELQTLLPELERKRIDLENFEIIKMVRASVAPDNLSEFVEAFNASMWRRDSRPAAVPPVPIAGKEGHDSDDE
jgi:predicted translin family RNA/ssDNA-binding protein